MFHRGHHRFFFSILCAGTSVECFGLKISERCYDIFLRMIPNYCDAYNDEVNPKETDQITLMKQSDQVLCCLPLALQ